mmetsp:Transcript_37666/g.64240  ORF Transcript_37666/g.64240 Transcript_37666/m.64240 type:complete len:137 (+) Transcript_37666:1236-1646(+)
MAPFKTGRREIVCRNYYVSRGETILKCGLADSHNPITKIHRNQLMTVLECPSCNLLLFPAAKQDFLQAVAVAEGVFPNHFDSTRHFDASKRRTVVEYISPDDFQTFQKLNRCQLIAVTECPCINQFQSRWGTDVCQ